MSDYKVVNIYATVTPGMEIPCRIISIFSPQGYFSRQGSLERNWRVIAGPN